MFLETSMTLLRDAAGGSQRAREEFARAYLPVVRAYLTARWRHRLSPEELEEAVQELFIACLRDGGLLERIDVSGQHSFRAYLFGAVRNIALELERSRRRREVRAKAPEHAEGAPVDEESLSLLFDSEWARGIVRRARALYTEKAAASGAAMQRRVELLALRFGQGLQNRDIAERWDMNPKRVQKDYAQAKQEFSDCLRAVIGFDNPGRPEVVAKEFAQLPELLR
ncbi:MAG: sigma-70 family RNA polymerase sigma factor [Planctomycetota bacterium]